MARPPEAPPRTHRKGRRCVKCGMPLSIYNPGKECRCHSVADPKQNPVCLTRNYEMQFEIPVSEWPEMQGTESGWK